jgi:hypothetical protein
MKLLVVVLSVGRRRRKRKRVVGTKGEVRESKAGRLGLPLALPLVLPLVLLLALLLVLLLALPLVLLLVPAPLRSPGFGSRILVLGPLGTLPRSSSLVGVVLGLEGEGGGRGGCSVERGGKDGRDERGGEEREGRQGYPGGWG